MKEGKSWKETNVYWEKKVSSLSPPKVEETTHL